MKRQGGKPMGDEEVNWENEEVREKPMGDEEVREMKRRGGERVGDEEMKDEM
jgi:hypothetical protein